MRRRTQRLVGAARGAGRFLAIEVTGRGNSDLRAAARIGMTARRAHRTRWEEAAQRVLFFSPRYWTIHQAWEGTIAHALERRGAATRFLYCGQAMPLCDAHLLESLPGAQRLCDDCAGRLPTFLGAFGLRGDSLGGLVQPNELPGAEIEALKSAEAALAFEWRDQPLGRHIRPSLLRFFRAGTLAGTPEELRVAREFLRGACAVLVGGERALEKWRPTAVVLLNGKFAAESVMMAVARARGIDVVTYERGFIVDTLLFDRNACANDYELSAEVVEEAQSRELLPAESERLDDYLRARTSGSRSIVQYWSEVEERPEVVRREIGVSADKPLTALFPNILWDTAILDKDVHFQSMFDWIGETIRWFAGHPEQALVVRCHPAEVRLPRQTSMQRVEDWIKSNFGDLLNVRVISSSSPLSSYEIMSAASRVLVYTSTVGLEAALRGHEVIVAGKTHYARRGFTLEPQTRDGYAALLSRSPAPLSVERLELARRYANLFFFRFMLPFRVVTEPERARISMHYKSITELAPGRDETLDIVCDGILHGKPFLRA